MLSDMNATASIQNAEQRIQQIKAELGALGEMRPGSLSEQYNVCGKPNCRCKDPKNPQRHEPYYQLMLRVTLFRKDFCMINGNGWMELDGEGGEVGRGRGVDSAQGGLEETKAFTDALRGQRGRDRLRRRE